MEKQTMVIEKPNRDDLRFAKSIKVVDTPKKCSNKGRRVTVKEALQLIATGDYVVHGIERGYISLSTLEVSYNGEYVVELWRKPNA
jgi:hypothetical protein